MAISRDQISLILPITSQVGRSARASRAQKGKQRIGIGTMWY